MFCAHSWLDDGWSTAIADTIPYRYEYSYDCQTVADRSCFSFSRQENSEQVTRIALCVSFTKGFHFSMSQPPRKRPRGLGSLLRKGSQRGPGGGCDSPAQHDPLGSPLNPALMETGAIAARRLEYDAAKVRPNLREAPPACQLGILLSSVCLWMYVCRLDCTNPSSACIHVQIYVQPHRVFRMYPR